MSEQSSPPDADAELTETPPVDESSGLETPDAVVAPVSDDAIMDVEVTIRFSVGSAKTSLRDVTSIQPGYVFETQTSVTNPVTIELNGATLGRGELVMIGDRIGVKVKEYPGHG